MRIRSAQRTPSLLPSILQLQHRSGDQILGADLAAEAMMAHVLHLQQTYRRMLGGVRATIGAILGAVTAEHTLALRAATKAASPRQGWPKCAPCTCHLSRTSTELNLAVRSANDA